MTLSVSIIGAGRLGGALAIALSKKNYLIKQLVSHRTDISNVACLISPTPEILSFDNLEKLSAEIIFITVPDSEIAPTAKNLAKKSGNNSFVFHCSGVLSSSVLEPLKEIGYQVGSIHPLVSVSQAREGAENFKDVFFCVEGEPSAVALAKKIVADLEGKSFNVAPEFKALYHASAVMASGHQVTLFSSAVEMLTMCGLNETEAKEVLFPLIESTVKNLAMQTPAQALTGPFARADVETLKLHLQALDKNSLPEISQIYRQLGLYSLHLADRQGANEENLAKIKDLMLEAER